MTLLLTFNSNVLFSRMVFRKYQLEFVKKAIVRTNEKGLKLEISSV